MVCLSVFPCLSTKVMESLIARRVFPPDLLCANMEILYAGWSKEANPHVMSSVTLQLTQTSLEKCWKNSSWFSPLTSILTITWLTSCVFIYVAPRVFMVFRMCGVHVTKLKAYLPANRPFFTAVILVRKSCNFKYFKILQILIRALFHSGQKGPRCCHCACGLAGKALQH